VGRGLSYVFAVIALLAGCGSDHEPVVPGQTILEVWAHAGQAAERSTLEAQVARFNRRRHDIAIRLTFIPERSYNAQVQASAIAGDLPDLLEFDGPYLYNYVWQQQLQPLDALLPARPQADLLPSIPGWRCTDGVPCYARPACKRRPNTRATPCRWRASSSCWAR
jgi:multiple sugar transport system substrate-binding protein